VIARPHSQAVLPDPGRLSERVVVTFKEGVAAVVLKAHLTVIAGDGVSAEAVVETDGSAQSHRVSASTALLRVPIVAVFGVGGAAIAPHLPSVVARFVVARVVARPGLAECHGLTMPGSDRSGD
jgi:hypothetical protein